MMEEGDSGKLIFNKRVPTVTHSSVSIAVGFFVIGVALIVVFINEFELEIQQSLIVMLAGILVYAISIYLAIKIKHVKHEYEIPKPEIRFVSNPQEIRLVPQVFKEEVMVPRIIRQEVKVPVYIKKRTQRKQREQRKQR
jgi:hypothetical protein